MANRRTFHEATGETASTTGEVIVATPGTDALRVVLNVTAASGTGRSLDVVIEDSVDDGATWVTRVTFAQKMAAGTEAKDITGPIEKLRVRSTIGGATPSFDYTVKAIERVPR